MMTHTVTAWPDTAQGPSQKPLAFLAFVPIFLFTGLPACLCVCFAPALIAPASSTPPADFDLGRCSPSQMN